MPTPNRYHLIENIVLVKILGKRDVEKRRFSCLMNLSKSRIGENRKDKTKLYQCFHQTTIAVTVMIS